MPRYTLAQVAKAITAAVTGGAAAFAAAYVDQQVTTPEWVTIGVAVVVGGLAVFAVPNAPADQP